VPKIDGVDKIDNPVTLQYLSFFSKKRRANATYGRIHVLFVVLI